jgi:hypothetical protein
MEPHNTPESSEQLELSPVEDLKAQKIAEERAKVRDGVAAGRLDTMQEKVAWILNHYPEARDSDITLQLKYWKEFQDDLFDGHSISAGDYYKLTRLTSIGRERARIQNVYNLFLANDEIRKQRGKREDSEHEKSIQQHKVHHHYAVYLDESGKTGNHLVVGSMWFLDGSESLKIHRRLNEWKKANSFEGEFHFNEISDGKLDQYIAAVDVILENSSVVSFKALSVERRGTGKVEESLAALTCHLLVKGIEFEHENNRAPLPRWLQIWKDSEQAGYDKIFLANLHDQLKQAAVTRFSGNLFLDEFYSTESKSHVLIQIADLFTSSLGRILNRSGEKKHAKDRFAEYFLAKLNMPEGPTQRDCVGDMAIHIAL